jgi:hypothetical protein
MNNLELDAVAQGMFLYLRGQVENPLDGIAITGMVLLKIFDNATQDLSIEQFAEDFRKSLIESYKARSAPGPESVQ